LAPLAEALAAAAKAVARVAAGRSLGFDEGRDAATTDLCYGTLRRYGRSQAIVAALSSRGQSTHAQVEALLWCALYALESGRYADYTVLDQAGRACELLELTRAKGYVNALLRAFQRGRAALEAKLQADPQARLQHPLWWIERVRAQYPQAWESILAAGNDHPPMCLRVNTRRTTTQAYIALLAAQHIASQQVGPAAVLLARPVPSARLPGYADGMVSVQDAGAQRAASLLDAQDGQRVLDACAAPGGKAAHILETADVALTALDADGERLRDVAQGLARLGLGAQLVAADCTAPEAWWDGKPYERILADVPCSASGIVRRHPDIKWLRRANDPASFAARQARILDALWRLLGPGGKLLYVTCSVFGAENDEVVEGFLARSPDARRAALADGGPAQLLPAAAHDGFYFALLEKPD
jgi:16S rRNA (cytosine967-C5)-methyltransferase